ncbi:hypothetical protein [Halomonas elongata]|uniref:hypothetical protein n=1 Tax=Halomonas elongata TaxID=2746 RepID=UPI004033C05F
MEYNEYFVRGYYVSKNRRGGRFLNSWTPVVVGGYSFQFHPKTSFNISQTSKGDESVVLIGLPVDVDSFWESSSEITCRCAKILEVDGYEAVLRYVAYLGGRFIVFVVKHESGVRVIPDCHATYACYYTEKNGGAFSSHVNLLGLVEELEVNEDARRVVNSPDYKSPGGKYYPALMLPYLEALTLLPNCYIENDYSFEKIKNKRFYPFCNTSLRNELAMSEVTCQFNELLSRNLKGIVKDRSFYISLTGGTDSGVALSSVVRNGLSKNAKAFTYFNASSPNLGAVKDVMSASRRAFDNNIPHKVVDLKPLDLGSKFHEMYTGSFKLGARFPSLARAYYEELPHDILSLVSTCSETGTAFYRKRDESKITAEVLSEKFSRSKINEDPYVLKSFSDYIDYAEFTKERLGDLDFYDAFYWEHRNAKWASLWYAEADLSHFTVVPYNQRGIIELMLSLPYSEREGKTLLNASLCDI